MTSPLLYLTEKYLQQTPTNAPTSLFIPRTAIFLRTKLEQRNSLNLPLCQECGGRCCQGSPGIWIDPERFFTLFSPGQRLTAEELLGRLPKLGLVFWGKQGVQIPAPRSLASGCAFLGIDGCRLSVVQRPCQCLAMIPVKETLALQQGCDCRVPEEFSREVARQHWQHYWQSL